MRLLSLLWILKNPTLISRSVGTVPKGLVNRKLLGTEGEWVPNTKSVLLKALRKTAGVGGCFSAAGLRLSLTLFDGVWSVVWAQATLLGSASNNPVSSILRM